MIKKIAIFSDIHGNLEALTSILKDIKKRKIKSIYCLGDVIGIGPNPKECLDLIIENNIKMVLGNHELYYLKGTDIDKNMDEGEKEHHRWISKQLNNKHKEYLNKCNIRINKKIANYNIALEHFLLNNNEYPYEDLSIINDENLIKRLDSDITFIGHEHTSFQIESNNKKLIDVGSCGCTKDDNTFYTLLTIDNNNIQIRPLFLRVIKTKAMIKALSSGRI